MSVTMIYDSQHFCVFEFEGPSAGSDREVGGYEIMDKNLRREIFRFLDIIRTYSKVPGKKPSFDDPFSLKKGTTVGEMARAVHKDFVEKFKYARVWRRETLQGQMVNRDFALTVTNQRYGVEAGQPVVEGAYDLAFALYAAEAGGCHGFAAATRAGGRGPSRRAGQPDRSAPGG